MTILFKQGYSTLFNKNIFIKFNRSFICSGILVNGLYLITPKIYEIHDTELNKSQNLSLKSVFLLIIQCTFGIYNLVILI